MPFVTTPLPACFCDVGPQAWVLQDLQGNGVLGLAGVLQGMENSPGSPHGCMRWSLAALHEGPVASSSSSGPSSTSTSKKSGSKLGGFSGRSCSSLTACSEGRNKPCQPSRSGSSSSSFVPCALVGDLFAPCSTLHAFKSHPDLDQLLGGSKYAPPSTSVSSDNAPSSNKPTAQHGRSGSRNRTTKGSERTGKDSGSTSSTVPDLDVPVQLLLRLTQPVDGRRLFYVSRDEADLMRKMLVLDRFNELLEALKAAASPQPAAQPNAVGAWSKALASWLQPKPSSTPPLLPLPPATVADGPGSSSSSSTAPASLGAVSDASGSSGRSSRRGSSTATSSSAGPMDSSSAGGSMSGFNAAMGVTSLLGAHELARLEQEAVTAEATAIMAELEAEGSRAGSRSARNSSSSSRLKSEGVATPSASFVGRMPLEAAYKLLAAAPDAFDVVCSDSDAQAVRDGKGRRTLLDCRSLLGPAGRWKWHVESQQHDKSEQEDESEESSDEDTSDNLGKVSYAPRPTTRTPVFVVPGLHLSVRSSSGTHMSLSPAFLSLSGIRDVVEGVHSLASRAWLATRAGRRERLRKEVEGYAVALASANLGIGGVPAAPAKGSSGGEDEDEDEDGHGDLPESKALLAELGEQRPPGGGGAGVGGAGGPPPGQVVSALNSAALGAISVAGHAVCAAADLVDRALVKSFWGPGLVGVPKHLAIQAAYLEDLVGDMAASNAAKIKAGALGGIVAARPPASPTSPAPSSSSSFAPASNQPGAGVDIAAASDGSRGSTRSSKTLDGAGAASSSPEKRAEGSSGSSTAHRQEAGTGSSSGRTNVSSTVSDASAAGGASMDRVPQSQFHSADNASSNTTGSTDTPATGTSTEAAVAHINTGTTSSSSSLSSHQVIITKQHVDRRQQADRKRLPTVGELRAAEKAAALESLHGVSVLVQAAYALVHASKAGDGQLAAWLGRGPWTGQAKLSKGGDGEVSVVMDITMRAIPLESVMGIGSSKPGGGSSGTPQLLPPTLPPAALPSADRDKTASSSSGSGGSTSSSSGNSTSSSAGGAGVSADVAGAGAGGDDGRGGAAAGPAGRVVTGPGVRVQDVSGPLRLVTPALTPAKPQHFQVGFHINTHTLLGLKKPDEDDEEEESLDPTQSQDAVLTANRPGPSSSSTTKSGTRSAPSSTGAAGTANGTAGQVLQQGTQLQLPPGAGASQSLVLDGLLLIGDVGLGSREDGEELPWRTPPLGTMDLSPLMGVMAARQAAAAARKEGCKGSG